MQLIHCSTMIKVQTSGSGLFSRVQAHGGGVLIPFSGVLEQKLADMPPDEVQVYCKENDLTRFVPAILMGFVLF